MYQAVSGNSSGNGAVTGVTLPAQDIERLLHWAYGVQRVGWLEGRGVGLAALEAAADGNEVYGVSGCGCAAVARMGVLGVRVDTSRVGGHPDAAPDALALHQAVLSATRGVARGLVIRHAEAGTRPDWDAPGIRCLPVMRRKRGEDVPEVVLSDKGRRPLWCPVRYTGRRRDDLEAIRQVWSTWRSALLAVRFALLRDGRRIRGALPTGPAAPAEPWRK